MLVALYCWAPQVAHAGVTLLDLPACQNFTPAGDLRYWCGPAPTFRKTWVLNGPSHECV